MTEHVDVQTIVRFGARELSREEMHRIGWHLAQCAACRERLAEAGEAAESLYASLFPGREPQQPPDRYRGLVGRVLDRVEEIGAFVAEHRRLAPALAEELLAHPPERRRWLVEQVPRYQSYAVAECLLEVVRHGSDQPIAEIEELAELVAAMAERLDPETYGGEGVLNDLKAEAWGLIADCRRRRAAPEQVDDAFRIAEDFLAHGSLDPVERGSLCELEAAWAASRGQGEEADALLERAVSHFRLGREAALAARSLLARARLARGEGLSERAVGWLAEAVELLGDEPREPRLEMEVKAELVHSLDAGGRPAEARELLPEVRALADRFGSPFERQRILWQEGRVLEHLGEIEEAECVLQEVHTAYLEMGAAYDAALVSLDLASLYLADGRKSDARALASQLGPIFDSGRMHREAIAALTFIHQATAEERATPELVDEVRTYLHRARKLPALHFRPPA